MNKRYLFLTITILTGLLSGCIFDAEKSDQSDLTIGNPILGEWIKNGHGRQLLLDFKDNGIVEGVFTDHSTIKPVVKFFLENDTIHFLDKEGYTCKGAGTYKIYQTEYYLAFDVIDDKCGGRIKTISGYWTKPGYEELLQKLDDEISSSSNTHLLLNKARIYMAIGNSEHAKNHLDEYMLIDSTNARAYINRAATCFPHDMAGAVMDCNKSIAIDPYNKNAFFLRGLARYDLGEREQACEDFKTAINLGFSILKIAEQQKCAEFWETE